MTITLKLKKTWGDAVHLRGPLSFIDILPRTYSHVVFSNSAIAGLLLLAGFADHPAGGILSIVSIASAIATAVIMRVERSLIRSGVFGANAALVGLALAFFSIKNETISLPLIALTILCGAFSALLVKLLLVRLSFKFDLPVLSIPFQIAAWLGIAIAPWFAASGNLAWALPSGYLDRLFDPHVPVPLGNLLKAMSAIFFQNSIFIGGLVFLGMFAYSRISTCLGLLAGALGLVMYNALIPGDSQHGELFTVAFNCALIAIALGGIFVRLTWQSVLVMLSAVVVSAPLSIILFNIMDSYGLHPLAAPFNIVTLGLIAVLRFAPGWSQRFGLERVSLMHITKPENSLDWRIHLRPFAQQTRLTLPFHGTWHVYSGNHSQDTHSGKNSFAWDFMVLGAHGRAFRGMGVENEDYYSFGLPVLAPASGRVVKVVNSIRDSKPYFPNYEQSWGNYLLIDHGSGEFSEISHFKHNSIVVQEGERVTTGQLLGRCGSSGHAEAPHIHYQLQRGGVLGSQTLPARFHGYVAQEGSKRIAVREGIPKTGQDVSVG